MWAVRGAERARRLNCDGMSGLRLQWRVGDLGSFPSPRVAFVHFQEVQEGVVGLEESKRVSPLEGRQSVRIGSVAGRWKTSMKLTWARLEKSRRFG
jgi:hypothetical protein